MHYTNLHLQVAVPYGGREEIISAVKSVLQEKLSSACINQSQQQQQLQMTGDELLACITDSAISAKTYSSRNDVGPVDFMIRTSGEIRTSGFMLWESAYSEMYFMNKLWPELNEADYLSAVLAYTKRQKRCGA